MHEYFLYYDQNLTGLISPLKLFFCNFIYILYYVAHSIHTIEKCKKYLNIM